MVVLVLDVLVLDVLVLVGCSTLLYLIFALVLGATCTRDALQDDYLIAEKVRVHVNCLVSYMYNGVFDSSVLIVKQTC